MRRRVRVFGACLILVMAVAVVAAPASAVQEGHFDRTLSVTGAVDLTVHTGSGNIAVKPGDSNKVEIHATIRANHSWMNGDASARIHDIETNPPIEQNGNTIRIGHFDDRELEHNISVSYDVIVPAQTKLHSESGSGDETIDGIAGPVEKQLAVREN
jgi:hypothetical protein